MPISRVQRTAPQSVGWTLDKLVCWGLVMAVVFVMGADFRGDTGEDFQVHWQIYLRLLVAFVCGVVGVLLMFPRSFRDYLAWPGLLLTAYVGWYLVTIPTGIDRSFTAAAWVSLLGVAAFVPGAMRLLGGWGFMTAVAVGLTIYLIGSWIAYLLFPEIGVFQEQVTRTEVFERMGGLGHPNELGFYSAYTVLVFTSLGISKRMNMWLVAAGVALGAVTLVGCFSRTAIVVCCFGLVFALQGQWRVRGNAFAIALGLALATGAGLVALGSGKLDWAIDRALKKVTKSGSTEELATATGRTEIWQYGIKKISESPLTGYGYCSARFIMVDHSYHCHNIVLNAMMFGGVISGLIVGSMVLYFVYSLIFNPRPEVDGIIACMVAGGMIEGLISAPSPAASILLWIAMLFWRQQQMHIGWNQLDEITDDQQPVRGSLAQV